MATGTEDRNGYATITLRLAAVSPDDQESAYLDFDAELADLLSQA